MAKIVSTVKGKKLDVAKIKLKNEGTITVGNTKTNVRGDKLDAKTGKVVATRNQIKSQEYRLHTNIPINKPVTQENLTDLSNKKK